MLCCRLQHSENIQDFNLLLISIFNFFKRLEEVDPRTKKANLLSCEQLQNFHSEIIVSRGDYAEINHIIVLGHISKLPMFVNKKYRK